MNYSLLFRKWNWVQGIEIHCSEDGTVHFQSKISQFNSIGKGLTFSNSEFLEKMAEKDKDKVQTCIIAQNHWGTDKVPEFRIQQFFKRV